MKTNNNFSQEKFNKIVLLYTELAEVLGLDLKNPNFKETPQRIAGFWDEFLGYTDDNTTTTFENVSVDEMVILKDIPFYSLCSHHLLPFFGEISIGYITNDKVLGISKLARIAKKLASKPQVQEQLASEINQEIIKIVPNCLGVAVYIKGKHTCMCMRGVKSEGEMITSSMSGVFKSEQKVREEFLLYCLK